MVPKAERAVQTSGGDFTGDIRLGEFSVPTPDGLVIGVYRIEGVSADFCITKKPASLTCFSIQQHLMAAQEQLHAIELESS